MFLIFLTLKNFYFLNIKDVINTFKNHYQLHSQSKIEIKTKNFKF